MNKFQSRRVLITGGTRGIGRAIAENFKNLGHEVVVLYGSNQQIANQFTSETGIHSIQCDVANYEQCQSATAQAESILGGNVEILVNNAGVTSDSMLHKMSKQDWDKVMSTNLDSLFNITQPVIGKMREHNFGRIIIISSVNAYGCPGQTNYSATKAGSEGFMRSLALESASKGITVNCVAPGYINTEMVEKIPANVLDGIVSKVPSKRLGETQEIAKTVLFLAGEEASFITGQVVGVNGGLKVS